MKFEVASETDDAELRRVLRENPMGGAIRLSLQREPSFFRAAEVEGPEHQAVVARREDGSVCAFGTRSVRLRYVNGEPTRVGYLGSLRLDRDVRGDGRVVAGGYRKLRELHDADGATGIYLTSIMSDNQPARRLLESGKRGLPTYEFLCDFVTLVMSVRSRRWRSLRAARAENFLSRLGLRMKHGDREDTPAVGNLLRCEGSRYQFHPVWENPEGDGREFCLAACGAKIAACAALWDQQAVRQSVVSGYAPALRRWRRPLNLAAAVLSRPPLPDSGEAIRLGYVSHMASAADHEPTTVALVQALHALARTRGIDYLAAGFAASDPRLPTFQRNFGGRALRSRLYVVYWPDDTAGVRMARSLDDRLASPEVALL